MWHTPPDPHGPPDCRKRRADLWVRGHTPEEREWVGAYSPLEDPEAWQACRLVYDSDPFPVSMPHDIKIATGAWSVYCARHDPETLEFDVQLFEAYDAGVISEDVLCDIVSQVAATAVAAAGQRAGVTMHVRFVDNIGPLRQMMRLPTVDALVLRSAYLLLFSVAGGTGMFEVHGVLLADVDLTDAYVECEATVKSTYDEIYICSQSEHLGVHGQIVAHVSGHPEFVAPTQDAGYVDLAQDVYPDVHAANKYCGASVAWAADGNHRVHVCAVRGLLSETAIRWWDSVKHMLM